MIISSIFVASHYVLIKASSDKTICSFLYFLAHCESLELCDSRGIHEKVLFKMGRKFKRIVFVAMWHYSKLVFPITVLGLMHMFLCFLSFLIRWMIYFRQMRTWSFCPSLCSGCVLMLVEIKWYALEFCSWWYGKILIWLQVLKLASTLSVTFGSWKACTCINSFWYDVGKNSIFKLLVHGFYPPFVYCIGLGKGIPPFLLNLCLLSRGK